MDLLETDFGIGKDQYRTYKMKDFYDGFCFLMMLPRLLSVPSIIDCGVPTPLPGATGSALSSKDFVPHRGLVVKETTVHVQDVQIQRCHSSKGTAHSWESRRSYDKDSEGGGVVLQQNQQKFEMSMLLPYQELRYTQAFVGM